MFGFDTALCGFNELNQHYFCLERLFVTFIK
jgi:hypothetical protein